MAYNKYITDRSDITQQYRKLVKSIFIWYHLFHYIIKFLVILPNQ